MGRTDAARYSLIPSDRSHNDSMLPTGLGKGAVIAHRTGTLKFVLADAGIMVKRPHHDSRATDFIRQVSQIVYNYFDHPQLTTLP